MSPRVSLFTGALTTVLFVAVGVVLFAEQRTTLGAILVVLGVFRGAAWIRQLRRYRQAQAADDE